MDSDFGCIVFVSIVTRKDTELIAISMNSAIKDKDFFHYITSYKVRSE